MHYRVYGLIKKTTNLRAVAPSFEVSGEAAGVGEIRVSESVFKC